MTLIQKAQDFAHRAHDSIQQKRKYSGEPYWVHTDEVASIVAAATFDPLVIAAAHLHDYREDVVTKLAELGRIAELDVFEAEYREFPYETKQMVHDLTDVYVKEVYPNLNRKQRKEFERQRIANILPQSKTIKLADLISNTRSIVADDPNFARTYIREKIAVLPFLTEGNSELFQIASAQAIEAVEKLKIEIQRIR